MGGMIKMNAKSKKISILAALLALVCLALGLFCIKEVKTAGAETPQMVMQQGASARLAADGKNGLRFSTLVDKTFYDGLNGTTVEVGTLIIPADMLKEGELTLETPDAGKTVLAQEKVSLNDFSETQYSYSGALVNIKDGNLMRDFIGRGYILVDEGLETEQTYYAEQTDNVRSITYVLSAYLVDEAENPEYVAFAEQKIATSFARIESADPDASLEITVNGQSVAEKDVVQAENGTINVDAAFGGYKVAVKAEVQSGNLALTADGEKVGQFTVEGSGESKVKFGVGEKSVVVTLANYQMGTTGNLDSLYKTHEVSNATLSDGSPAIELTIPAGTELPSPESTGTLTFSLQLSKEYAAGSYIQFDWEVENMDLYTAVTGYNGNSPATTDESITENSAFYKTALKTETQHTTFTNIVFYCLLNRSNNNANVVNGVLQKDIVIKIGNLKITTPEEVAALGEAINYMNDGILYSDPTAQVRFGEMADGTTALEIEINPTNNYFSIWFNLSKAYAVGSTVSFDWEVENLPRRTYITGYFSSYTPCTSQVDSGDGESVSVTLGPKDGAGTEFNRIELFCNKAYTGGGITHTPGAPIIIRITDMRVTSPVSEAA